MLTDTKVRTAKAKEKIYKLADSNRLYLYITSKGYKSWRYDYTLNGKTNIFTIGEYPAVSLAQAREIHAELRAKVKNGVDPREEIEQARIEHFRK